MPGPWPATRRVSTYTPSLPVLAPGEILGFRPCSGIARCLSVSITTLLAVKLGNEWSVPWVGIERFGLRSHPSGTTSMTHALMDGVLPLPRKGDRLSAAELYEKNVIRADGCWGWRGVPNACGYGKTQNPFRPADVRTQPMLAHRLSWLLHRGAIPEGMCVCHHCDNPICTNPEHLFLGSHQDNMNDRGRKGRASGGRTGPG